MRKHDKMPDPSDEYMYQNGNTHPPKSFSGVIAAVLVSVILIGGVISILAALNKKLVQQYTQSPDRDALQFSFPEDAGTVATAPSSPAKPDTGISVDLRQSPPSAPTASEEGGLSLQEIYQKNIASVVSISCTTLSGDSSGTGVILSRDGYIVTNSHVISGAETVSVLTRDGQTLPAQIVGSDSVSDLAVLSVPANDLTPAEFGDSDQLQVGDAVAAIGDPLGIALRGTLTNGIVSAINRDITVSGRPMTLIQTNAAMNEGNSGGPLLNCFGQVVGINTVKIGDSVSAAGVEGLGFAIPSTTVKEIADQLLRQGYVTGRPSLGITAESISSFLQMLYHLPAGVYITAVDRGSDAAQKGLTPGDLLLAIDDTRITSVDGLSAALSRYLAGQSVTLTVLRGGRQYAVDVVLSQSTD